MREQKSREEAERTKSEAERQACEIRLRAERRAGELLKDLEKAVGGRPSKTKGGVTPSFPTKKQQIEQAGLTPDQAKNFQRLASVPQEIFDDELKHSPRPTTSANIEQVFPTTIKVGSILPKVGSLLLF